MFMTGNEVVAWAALAADADFMYGYPITPQNEIMHYWSRLAPHFGRGFLQTEDEISAGFTMLGGAMVGKKCFTATAGPGNILMQESISMAEMMRLPGVWIIQQRGGPSTATVIYSQQELRLTTTGGNGEGLRIVYSTSSHQELFEYTLKAFNAAWKYRFPAFVLGDGYQAKMRETVTLFRPEQRGWEMIPPQPILRGPGVPHLEREPVHLRNT
ncbi:MAG: ferredoxin oxidoreductase, partial [Firmicutes bacterium]|nr:ferredoxin oxidoreductase [Bacillota bacterium]